MDECCEAKSEELAVLRGRQGRVLVAVLAINAAMFFVEFGAGILARSTALLGDSLDMLGDSLVYGFSLYVLHKSLVWRARAARLKGFVMLAFGLGVLVEAALRVRTGVAPSAPVMAGIGALALAANASCFLLLWRHRADDLNLRSTWLCSRNDLIANSAVLVAAGLVAALQSLWPDVLVGVGISLLFLRTALRVLRESSAELARAHDTPLEITVAHADLDAPDSQSLIAALNAELAGLYSEAGANHFRLDPNEVGQGNGAFLVVHRDGVPIACGALRRLDADTGELKRMYVDPLARGLGLGRRLVHELEREARTFGLRRLVLETGIRQESAIALYRSTGFERIPLYGEYCLSPATSICFGKELTR